MVLGVTKGQLKRYERGLTLAGVPHCAIREPDAPWNGALMAIGVWPGDKATLAPYFYGLELLT